MLKPQAFANAVAATTVLFYLVLWVLGVVLPDLFKLVFNAQFLGANVASLYNSQDFASSLVTLVIVGVMGWVAGYLWAWFYNYWAK